jgi:hypothetical protein
VLVHDISQELLWRAGCARFSVLIFFKKRRVKRKVLKGRYFIRVCTRWAIMPRDAAAKVSFCKLSFLATNPQIVAGQSSFPRTSPQ